MFVRTVQNGHTVLAHQCLINVTPLKITFIRGYLILHLKKYDLSVSTLIHRRVAISDAILSHITEKQIILIH